jgi:hypothetical protein
MENVIFKYTREDALDDGYALDVSSLAHLAGFGPAVAVSVTRAGIWHGIIAAPLEGGQPVSEETESMRIAKVLNAVGRAIHAELKKNPGEYLFTDIEACGHKIWAGLEATEDGKPAVNIFTPSEY